MTPIKAIYDDDLIAFLQNIGIYAKLEAGKIRCCFCDEVVSLENFLGVFPDAGKISVACNHPACIKKLNAHDESTGE